MSESSHNAVKIFFSYSHKDKDLRSELEEQLSLLKNQGLVSTWHDKMIHPGDEFEKEISENLENADIILLLISPPFIASKYCYEKEMTRALERHEAKEARVIPIILRPCDWQTAPFGKLTALPEDGKPVTIWPNQDQAFLDVAKGIRRYIEENNKSEETPKADKGASKKSSKNFPVLPVSHVGFVSRQYKEGEDFVGSLVAELSATETEILVLWGPGGVGKTTLAAQVARSLQNEKEIIWIDADNRVDVSVGVLLDEIADALDYSEFRQYPPEKKREQVLYILRDNSTLVILDNFETVSPDSQSECLEFLKLPGFTSLITTRSKIDGVKNRRVNEMHENEAKEYLSRLIEDSALPQAFTTEVQNKIIEIAEKNPLVIQWIVGQIDLAQKPDEVFEDLTHGEGEAAERVFNRSFNLPQLGDDGRRILLVHSLFTQEARRKSIKEIVGISDNKRFREAIGKITSLRLITVTEGGERVLLQGLTRQLARAALEKNSYAKNYRQKFVKYFCKFSSAHKKLTPENLQHLEEDKNNILSAIDLAFEINGSASVFQLVNNSERFFYLRGYWEEHMQFSTRALHLATQRNNIDAIGQFSTILATMFKHLGDLEKAEQLYKKCMEIDKRLGYRRGIAASLHNLGMIAEDRGDVEKAEDLYQKSLQIEEELENSEGVAATLNNLGNIAYHRGELEKAEELYLRSLEIQENLGDRHGVAMTLHNLGNTAQERGELEEATELNQKSLEIREKLGDQQGITMSYNNLGSLAQERGELEKAEELHQKSLAISRRLEDPQSISASINNLGNIAQERGELEKAEKLYLESLNFVEKLGNRQSIAAGYYNLGEVYLEKENFQKAEIFCDKSLKICQEIEIKKGIATNKLLLGRIKSKVGDLVQAEAFLLDSLETFQISGFASETAEAFWEYGLVLEKKEEFNKSLEYLKKSLIIYKKIGSPTAQKVQNDISRIENT